MVRRSAIAREISMEPMAPDDLRSEAMRILREQRRGLSGVRREDWLTLLQSVEQRETAMLEAALRGAPAYRVTVPEALGAPSAVEALAQALDIR